MHRPAVSLISLLLTAGCAGQGGYRIVTDPIVDLRTTPRTEATPGVHDPDQESQLLYGELVKVVKTVDGWAQVEAVEQPEYSHNGKWQGYPGWIRSANLLPVNQLMAPNILITEPWAQAWLDAYMRTRAPNRFPMGTRLRAIDMGGALWRVELPSGGTAWVAHDHAREMSELAALPSKEKRGLVLAAAKRLIGQPYYWGGRSVSAPGINHAALGVDCSGLVNLAYRVSGVDIPRDAHEQFLRAKKTATLEPADLIFLSAKGQPDKIVHVMIYAGGGDVLEAPGTGQVVRRIPLTTRLGYGVSQLKPGLVADEQTVHFGTYLSGP